MDILYKKICQMSPFYIRKYVKCRHFEIIFNNRPTHSLCTEIMFLKNPNQVIGDTYMKLCAQTKYE